MTSQNLPSWHWSSSKDLLYAILITLAMMAVSWVLSGGPGVNGIDDAAITRSYAENIVNGHGFVYNIGGERVEGATSMLWTLVVAIAYLFNDDPEILILGISAIFTIVSIFLAFRISRRAVGARASNASTIILIVSFFGIPGYYVWAVWSMMEIAIFSTLCLWTVDRLSSLAEDSECSSKFDYQLAIAAITMPLARPEGIAIFVGLCLLTVAIRRVVWRPIFAALAFAVLAFVTLILFRLAYFGFPFPNTYYAKVSTDRAQNIVDGLKYLASFINGQPFGGIVFGSWVILGIASAVSSLSQRLESGGYTQTISSALVIGVFMTYVVLGGDHFALWRFYQPIMPILFLPLLIFAKWAFDTGENLVHGVSPVVRAVAGCSLVLWLAINSLFVYQSRFEIVKEFEISARGERFGEYLNELEPLPVVAATAAGGIALTYEGRLLDLFGLNWVEMAHASPVKEGMRNHASFDQETFWKHKPDLLPQYTRPECQLSEWVEVSRASDSGINQLYRDARFLKEYTPVIMEVFDGGCVNAFALNGWLSQVSNSRIKPRDWKDLIILTK